jgi:hypothetical protein
MTNTTRALAISLDIRRLARQWVFAEIDFMDFIEELESIHEFWGIEYPTILDQLLPEIQAMERAAKLSITRQAADHLRVTGHPPTSH